MIRSSSLAEDRGQVHVLERLKVNRSLRASSGEPLTCPSPWRTGPGATGAHDVGKSDRRALLKALSPSSLAEWRTVRPSSRGEDSVQESVLPVNSVISYLIGCCWFHCTEPDIRCQVVSERFW